MSDFLTNLFHYDFMRHAFIAGTLAAVLAGAVGYFIVIRRLAFAGHALGHISFAGATGALLIGLSPMVGQLLLTIVAAFSMGLMGENLRKNDTAIGIVLAFALGLGSLFLSFYKGYAGQATIILFGNLLGVSVAALQFMLLLTVLSLVALAIIARPLLFISIEPELAEAKGVSLLIVATLFLIIAAVAVTLASQVVGVILVFTLLIGPAAIALQWTHNFWTGICVSILLAVGIVWLGISLAYFTEWPISFWISAIVFIVYLLGFLWRARCA